MISSEEKNKTITANLGHRNLVLVGMMGAGKSFIGRKLSEYLNLPFFDSDAAIEEAANMTIPEIFENHGEEEFRRGERLVIQRLLKKPPTIIATGGGAFIDETNRISIKENSITIWLKADIDILLERVMRNSNRPLLQKSSPREVIQNLLSERSPIYETADLTIESTNHTYQQTLSSAIDKLYAYFIDT